MRYFFSLLMVLMILVFGSVHVRAADQAEPPLITVTGDAEVRVIPDEVVITLGVETWNKDLTLAKNENDRRTQAVINAAKNQKVAEKHIQTDYLSIEPRYKNQYEHRSFIGYFVRKSIVITLKDTGRFEKMIAGLLETGANYVHGVQFRTTELRKYRDQARSLAIKAAREKAVALAGELDRQIGKPYKIQEYPSGWYSYYNSWWGGRYGGAMAQNVIQNTGGASETDGSIALGQIKVNAKVTVSFELE